MKNPISNFFNRLFKKNETEEETVIETFEETTEEAPDVTLNIVHSETIETEVPEEDYPRIPKEANFGDDMYEPQFTETNIVFYVDDVNMPLDDGRKTYLRCQFYKEGTAYGERLRLFVRQATKIRPDDVVYTNAQPVPHTKEGPLYAYGLGKNKRKECLIRDCVNQRLTHYQSHNTEVAFIEYIKGLSNYV